MSTSLLRCPSCAALITDSQANFCPSCGAALADANPASQELPATIDADATSATQKVAWEEIDSRGFFGALYETTLSALFTPAKFFAGLSHSKSNWMALLYAIILVGLGAVLGYVSNVLIIRPLVGDFALGGSTLYSSTGLICTPLALIFLLFFSTLYYQIILKITGSKHKDIKTTFRILCYNQCTAFWQAIPIIGAFIAFFWSLYLLYEAFWRVHGMSKMRSAVLLLLPMLILMVFMAVIVGVLIALGLFSMQFLKEMLAQYR